MPHILKRLITHIQYNLHPEVYKFTVAEWIVVIAGTGFGAYFAARALLQI